MQRVLSWIACPSYLVVVIALFLPWYEISCNGTPLVTATGLEVATSGFKTSSQMNAFTAAFGNTQSDHPAQRSNSGDTRYPWLLLAPIVALLGALAAAAVALRRGPVDVAARVAIAAGGVAFFVQGLQTGLLARKLALEKSHQMPSDGLARAMMASIDIKLELGSGWWLSLIGSMVASGAAIAAWKLRGRPLPSMGS